MEKKYQKIISLLGEDRVERDVPLANYTTFKIGGPADLFYEAATEEELVQVIKVVKEVAIPYFILGGGSNILVGDKGFRGMVIKVRTSNFKIQNKDNGYLVIAEAGVPIGILLNELADNSVAGLEFMAGIPGTVGATVACNAGAWQRSLSETIVRVKVVAPEGEVKWLDKDECDFGYRHSRFKGGNELILMVELLLEGGNPEEIKAKIAENLEKRSKQPKEPSAGSVFVNPKPLKTGELIEQCGLKGAIIGGAQISEKHANFIVNVGGAKASDVVALIELVKQKVKEKFGVDLKEEIVRVGEF